jgi:hypothetical protein
VTLRSAAPARYAAQRREAPPKTAPPDREPIEVPLKKSPGDCDGPIAMGHRNRRGASVESRCDDAAQKGNAMAKAHAHAHDMLLSL